MEELRESVANCPEALEVLEVLKEGSALAQSESFFFVRHLWNHGGHA